MHAADVVAHALLFDLAFRARCESSAQRGTGVASSGFVLKLAIAAFMLAGTFVGTGVFTFVHAKGHTYLSDDPAVCVNCHVMRDQYDGWRRGSHHAQATCNDCHLPHDNPIHALYVKASNGYRHSQAFT